MDKDKSEESEDDSEQDEPEVEPNVDLVEKLKPLFYNNKADVR